MGARSKLLESMLSAGKKTELLSDLTKKRRNREGLQLMGTRLLLIAAWLLPAIIVVLGISSGATIWFYMEPQMGSLTSPDTYAIAIISGLFALALSVLVAVGISIHIITSRGVESDDSQRRYASV